MVISHDADFLNAFTHGVLYLDVRTHIIEQYDGNYHDVVRDIAARIEKKIEKMPNTQRDSGKQRKGQLLCNERREDAPCRQKIARRSRRV